MRSAWILGLCKGKHSRAGSVIISGQLWSKFFLRNLNQNSSKSLVIQNEKLRILSNTKSFLIFFMFRIFKGQVRSWYNC